MERIIILKGIVTREIIYRLLNKLNKLDTNIHPDMWLFKVTNDTVTVIGRIERVNHVDGHLVVTEHDVACISKSEFTNLLKEVQRERVKAVLESRKRKEMINNLPDEIETRFGKFLVDKERGEIVDKWFNFIMPVPRNATVETIKQELERILESGMIE